MMREYTKAKRCHRRGRVRGCQQPIAGQCQYCARGFCADHGDVFGDHEEVCDRDPCQAKKADLSHHHAFLGVARARNEAGRCGMPDCDTDHASFCERCGPRYCIVHLQETVVMALHHGERGADVLRLCVHCLVRLEVWAEE
jgi:hypothetical protein